MTLSSIVEEKKVEYDLPFQAMRGRKRERFENDATVV